MSRISPVQLAGSVRKATLNRPFICPILRHYLLGWELWNSGVKFKWQDSLLLNKGFNGDFCQRLYGHEPSLQIFSTAGLTGTSNPKIFRQAIDSRPADLIIKACSLISLIILAVAVQMVFDVPSRANYGTSISRSFTLFVIDFSKARQVIESIFTRLIKLLTIGMLRTDLYYFFETQFSGITLIATSQAKFPFRRG